MNTQVRTSGGKSFWDLSGVSLKTLECGKADSTGDPWIQWQGRTWLCKQKTLSICEIVGYQLAEALKLPLQPWVAFFQNEKADLAGSRKVVGVLTERWTEFRWQAALWMPAQSHPDLVGRALALGILDRQEWPEWLMNEDKSDLRLFDLEFIGPFLSWPPQVTPVEYYRKNTEDAFSYAREIAHENGVVIQFMRGLKLLAKINFASIVDFSGHPHAHIMKRVVVRGLEARQQELERLLKP